MLRFGLSEVGNGMNDAVNYAIYQQGGLQFRVPAAITPERTFRTPSNLRPLASWYALWPDRFDAAHEP